MEVTIIPNVIGKKGKKHTIPGKKNYYGSRLRWWYSASGKYTDPRQIRAA